jgi:hypothetical protein
LAEDAKRWAEKIVDSTKLLIERTSTEDAIATDRRLLELEQLVSKL